MDNLGHLCTYQVAPSQTLLREVCMTFCRRMIENFSVVPWIYLLDSFFHPHLLLYKTDHLYDPHSIPFSVASGGEVYKQMNHP